MVLKPAKSLSGKFAASEATVGGGNNNCLREVNFDCKTIDDYVFQVESECLRRSGKDISISHSHSHRNAVNKATTRPFQIEFREENRQQDSCQAVRYTLEAGFSLTRHTPAYPLARNALFHQCTHHPSTTKFRGLMSAQK